MPFELSQIEKLDEVRWLIPRKTKPGMLTDAMVYADDRLMQDLIKDQSLEQAANVATLPGIVGRSLAMPDIHWGYGFPIGGVAAFDANDGVLSPGGVGFDINCGVRLLRSDLTEADVRPKLRQLVETLFDKVPSGVGEAARIKLSRADVQSVFGEGAAWAIRQGYGWEDDLARTEHKGRLADAKRDSVSLRA